MSDDVSDETEQAIDALYVGPLDRFIDERKALAKRVRGLDKARAAAVADLAKPTPAAWAVNRLAARGELDELFEAGAVLRAEQGRALAGGGDASELARATVAQRQRVTALVAEAKRDLAEASLACTEATLAKVKATLETLALWGALAPPGSPATSHGPRLARELDPPSLDALAELLGVTAGSAPSRAAPSPPPVPSPVPSSDAASATEALARASSGEPATRPAWDERERRLAVERDERRRAREERRAGLVVALRAAEERSRERRSEHEQTQREHGEAVAAARRCEAEATRLASELERARELARAELARAEMLSASLARATLELSRAEHERDEARRELDALATDD